MYCTYCGRDTSGLINYCTSCGHDLDPQHRFAFANISSFAANHTSSQLIGIGGWLMCFCILTTIVAPVGLFAYWDPDRLAFVRTIFGMVTGAMVWSVRPTALRWLRGYFVVGIVTRLASLILFSSTTYLSEAHWFEHFVNQLIGLFGIIAWFAYFHLSDRVKATFGSNL